MRSTRQQLQEKADNRISELAKFARETGWRQFSPQPIVDYIKHLENELLKLKTEKR